MEKGKKLLFVVVLVAMPLLCSSRAEAKPMKCRPMCQKQAQIESAARWTRMDVAPPVNDPRYVEWVKAFGRRYGAESDRAVDFIRITREAMPGYVRKGTGGGFELWLTNDQLERLARLELLWTDARVKVRNGPVRNVNAKLARLWFEEVDKTVVGDSRAKVRVAQRELRWVARKILLAAAK